MASRYRLAVEVFLVGCLLLLGTILEGIVSVWNDPVAWYYLALSLCNGRYYARYLQHQIGRYYHTITRELLVSRFRADLSYAQYCHFRSYGERRQERKRLRKPFDNFATVHNSDKVWTQDQFSAFIESRLGDRLAVNALWRCFCFSAKYPFVNKLPLNEYQLNWNEWQQAVAILGTNAVDNLDTGGAPGITIFAHGRRLKWSDWNGFFSISIHALSHQTRNGQQHEDNWTPPQVLDHVASVSATQLPIPRMRQYERLPDATPFLQPLIEFDENIPISTENYVVPYQDMLALARAVLRIKKVVPPTISGYPQPLNVNLCACTNDLAEPAVAEALPYLGGISLDTIVTFDVYTTFLDKFCLPQSDKYPSHMPIRSFHQELMLLWAQLFSISSHDEHPQPLVQSSESGCPPPTFISQALYLLLPAAKSKYDLEKRLNLQLEKSFDIDSGITPAALLHTLTQGYCPKTVVIYGTIDTSKFTTPKRNTRSQKHTKMNRQTQAAIFVIITASPLWRTFEGNSGSDSFLVDDKHYLLQLAPYPRALQFKTTEALTYNDIVNTQVDGQISFSGVSSQKALRKHSGLSVDCHTGMASLCFRSNEKLHLQNSAYTEVSVGDGPDILHQEINHLTDETTMAMDKIEVYNGPSGVDTGVIVGRSRKQRSRRR